MRRLSKTKQREWKTHTEAISAAEDEGREAYSMLMSEIESARTLLANAHAEYERVLSDVQQKYLDAALCLDDISEKQESYIDERSESWERGDAGGAYLDWRDAIDEMRKRMQAAGDAMSSAKPAVEFEDDREWLTDYCLEIPVSSEEM